MIINAANRLNNVQEYYFSRKLAEIADLQQQGKSIINLGIGSPDMAPSAATISKLQAVAEDPKSHGYQGYRGVPALRKAIAGWSLKTYHSELDAEKEILPLMGSKEGIMHIALAFLNYGDEVLVPNPGYPTYSAVAELTGARLRYYELSEENGWLIDVEKLRKQNLSRVKLMWVNYPHMPTGANATKTLYESLVALAKEKQFLLVNDNPYSLVLNDHPQSLLAVEGAKEVALELNSLSKSHNMAGWRIGWLAGGAGYIDTVLKVKSNMDSGMFLGLQMAAIEALSNTEEWHRKRNEEYAARRELAFQLLDVLGCTYTKTQVGLFVWAKAPAGTEVEAFVDNILYETGIFITPGFIFGSQGKHYVRVSLCAPQETYREAIERIKSTALISK